MDLDESIRQKLRTLRLSLRFSVSGHDESAAKGKALIAAINDFLGDRPNGNSQPPEPAYGLVTDAVRSVLFGLKESTFTVEHVQRALAAIKDGTPATRQTISITLWKMAERGELEIVERGAGRKPTLYKVRQLQIIRHKRV